MTIRDTALMEIGIGMLLGLLLAPIAAYAGNAVDDDYTVPSSGTLSVAAPGVLENDQTRDQLPSLTATLVDSAASGAVTLNTDGGFSYVYDSASGSTSDSFTYQFQDSTGLSNVATVTLTIPQDGAIDASADSYSMKLGQSLSVAAPGVLENDIDTSGQGLTAALDTPTSLGTLTFNADGSFTYDYSGTDAATDSFTYTATNGITTTDPVRVTINITAPEPVDPSGTIVFQFPAVALVGLVQDVGPQNQADLSIGSEEGMPATVVGPSPSFDLPASTPELIIRVRDNRYIDDALSVMKRCERLALVAQARSDKYTLDMSVEVNDVGQQVTSDPERIGITMQDGSISCALRRPLPSNGGDGTDCTQTGTCDNGRG